MKKHVLPFLCVVLLQFQSAFATSHVTTDSISYLKIAELEYKDGQLFLLENVKPIGHEDYEGHRLTLSAQEAGQFLQVVKELKLSDIRSNDDKKWKAPPKKKKDTVFSKEGLPMMPIDEAFSSSRLMDSPYPFEIEFVKNGRSGKISAYRNGMSEAERQALESYLRQIDRIVDRRSKIRALLATLPDGEYRVKDWKRYAVYIGPRGWEPWAKRGNSIKTDDPLYILDGKVVDPEKDVLRDISPHDIESMEIFKDAEVIKTYGEQAKHGVIIIKTKK